MFLRILLFELQNRARRPAVYLYFLAVFGFTLFSFATGSLPVGEKEHINSPSLIGFWCAGITMMMMLISSSLMGTAIYRDIEYQTKDYYLTYPITRPGYFWGRYFGAFIWMLVIAGGVLAGIYGGTLLGPAIGKTVAAQYGPNDALYYWQPFATIALPNIFFTCSLFFGLVALTRNVKVIYFGGILLFLFYFIGLFFLGHTDNADVINIADPFGLNGLRYVRNNLNSVQRNTLLLPLQGAFGINRLLWPGLGLLILVVAYLRFNFTTFFSGRPGRQVVDATPASPAPAVLRPQVSFSGAYNRRTLRTLVKLEVLNIVRDNYFWIIVVCGCAFLGFVFWLGNNNYGVPNYPRTVELLQIFADGFPFFIFFIIMFYTGETLQRDRLTRYAFINDTLPPPNRLLSGSKLIALLLMAVGLSTVPLLIAMGVQLLKGYYQFNFSAYGIYWLLVLLPKLLMAVAFCFVVQVIFNNKFAAYAFGVALWIGIFFLDITGIFNYRLLLYGSIPAAGISDMDGMGHMKVPVAWFDLYWLLAASLLIIIAALFYYRGTNASLKERLQLIPQRFDRRTKLWTALLLPAYLLTGGFIYYNISYLNEFLTQTEQQNRAILYEQTLKRYQQDPLPKLTQLQMNVDLFPDRQQEFVLATAMLVNKTNRPITRMLLDGDNLSDYSITLQGKPLAYSSPLLYKRGAFSWLRPAQDTAPFRLYQFPVALQPGDTTVLAIRGIIQYDGFQNGLFAQTHLYNTTTFAGELPGLGYDAEDEISSPYVRRKAGLPVKVENEFAANDPAGTHNLRAGQSADLFTLDVTVSTPADQTALTQGELVQQWQHKGRNYFHYRQNNPGMYMPFGIVAARYAERHKIINVPQPVDVAVYYHPAHEANVDRLLAACEAGLQYYSTAYGPYPYRTMRLAETSVYGPPQPSTSMLDGYAEYNAWQAHFTNPNQFDYLYFATARTLAQQWWRFRVAPNNTVGAMVIPEGLANYDALVLSEHKYGAVNMRNILQDQLWAYLGARRHLEDAEHPLITANEPFEWSGKASVALYGLRDLIGEDKMNRALRAFKDSFQFRSQPPFAGAGDLYRCLQREVPDSLQYYLEDSWQKITLYDNNVVSATAVAAGKDLYKVSVTVNVSKAWIDAQGKEQAAQGTQDYIDIGVFAPVAPNQEGVMQAHPLYLQRHRLTAGLHSFTWLVKGKPSYVGIDPLAKLVDRNPGDNMRDL